MSWLVLALLVALAPAGGADAREPVRYQAEIVAEYPHDPKAFTQGLFIADGRLFESTGQYFESTLREVDLSTGAVLRKTALPPSVFGEGAVDWNDEIVVLTWREQTGFVFGRDDFSKRREFAYEGEGWGLTRDDARLIMSDGTSVLRFLDPETLKENGRLEVTLRGKPLPRLNELEFVEGEIFANVWFTNAIARIDPETGVVVGLIDLRPLRDRMPGLSGQAVLNGIAYDRDARRLFVTGKNWPKLFEIRLSEAGG